MTEKLEIGKEIMDLAIDVLSACRKRGDLIATAKSCTGGLLAGTLTAIPGARTFSSAASLPIQTLPRARCSASQFG